MFIKESRLQIYSTPMRNLRNILYSYWHQKYSTAVVDDFYFEKGIIPLFDHFFYDISQFFKMYVKWTVDSDIGRINAMRIFRC